MLHGIRALFLVLNPLTKLGGLLIIRASISFFGTPFRSQAPVAIAKKRKPHPVPGATAPHLALGPASARDTAPSHLSEYPWEHFGPAPAYPGAGHVYRLRTVVRRGSGLPRAQPHSHLAPLIRCRPRHRRWARRAAGIALHPPPWPPPPPSASAKDPAPGAATTATAATGSPGRLRASRPARPATSGLPRPYLSHST